MADLARETRQTHTFLASYEVAISVDGKLYLYRYLCSNHLEALMMALKDHMEAGYPLPLGTPCLVQGPCADSACDCGGKLRLKLYVTLPRPE